MANVLANYMFKRPLKKSYFRNNNSDKGRWFVLNPTDLSYHEGSPDGRPLKKKNQIHIDSIKVVEKVDDEEEFVGKANVFQILFDEGRETYVLYIIACTSAQQDTWITRLREVLTERNVVLNSRYHPKAYNHSMRQYNCCQGLGINALGCTLSMYKQNFKPPPASTLPTSPAPLPTVKPNQEQQRQRAPRNNGGRNNNIPPPLPAPRPVVNAPKPSLHQVIAVYDYDAGSGDELDIVKGNYYDIIDVSENPWWKARDKYGNEGYIPASYVQLVTDLGLEQFDWYYKDISRARAEQLVRNQGVEGTFLVRDSTSYPGQYTLIVFANDSSNSNGVVKQYQIKRDDNQNFYITNRLPFDSILDLIQFYKSNRSGLVCCLRKPPGGGRSSIRPTAAGLGHDVWEVNRNELQLTDILGVGQYGTVRKAIWRSSRGARVLEVAVKSVKDGILNDDNFVNEAETLKQLQHPNLVQLFGVCTRQKPILIITEFMVNGSLLDFLKRYQSSIAGCTSSLVDMCLQVCSAMEYLELKCFIHRSLAARNCLVNENCVVKVGDFALARFVTENEYVSSSGEVNVRWAAPEVLTHLQYSSKSDVWAYGVLAWEIFSFGETPYSPKSPAEVTNAVVNRKFRLSCPNGCPKGVFDLIRLCWRTFADDRPSFSMVTQTLLQMQDLGFYNF